MTTMSDRNVCNEGRRAKIIARRKCVSLKHVMQKTDSEYVCAKERRISEASFKRTQIGEEQSLYVRKVYQSQVSEGCFGNGVRQVAGGAMHASAKMR